MSSGSFIPIHAGLAAAIVAEAAKKKREEEEKMTQYTGDDLDGWEFKIIRANTRKFKNKEIIEKVRQEEARAGWELLEKFDDYRLRFKRRIEKRSMDTHLEFDPYRSQISSSNGAVIALVIAIFIALTGVFIALWSKFDFDSNILGGFTLPGLILGLIVVIGFIGGIVVLAKKK